MRKPTVWNAFFTVIASFALVATSIPALAQHGGGHGGGGGGHAGGGFAGGSHSGGSYGGGGYHGGGSSYGGGRGFSGGVAPTVVARGAHLRRRCADLARPTPGLRKVRVSVTRRRDGTDLSAAVVAAWRHAPARRSVARAGSSGMAGRGSAVSRAAIADGAWHSFGGVRSGSVLASNVGLNRGGFGFNSFAWRGGFAGRGFWGIPASDAVAGASVLAGDGAVGAYGSLLDLALVLVQPMDLRRFARVHLSESVAGEPEN